MIHGINGWDARVFSYPGIGQTRGFGGAPSFMERLKHRHGVSNIMTRVSSRHPPYLENNPDLESRLDEILEETWVAGSIATMCQGRY